MSRNRTYIWKSSFDVADNLNITRGTVHDILYGYICYCKELLKQGYRVDFPGLVTISSRTRQIKARTLAYNCKIVADKLSLPEHTVQFVIKKYIEDCIDGLKSGSVVELRGLCTLHPLRDVNGFVKCINSDIAQGLKKELGIFDLRVYTCKYLRQSIKSNFQEAVANI